MFQKLLDEAIRKVDGALACSLVGFDGIPVETAYSGERQGIDPGTLGTELANHVATLARTFSALEIGPLAELTLTGGRLWSVIRLLGPNYFLVLLLKPGANIGKGRFMLRVVAPRIRKEF